MMDKSAKIYVAGHRGLVGSALVGKLRSAGYNNLILKTHSELDLTNQGDSAHFFEETQPDYVFLAAAKVGGIVANNTYPAEFIRDNLAIQTNIIHEAYKANVKRLLFLGSSCIYPKLAPQPMKEEYLLTGPLEPTNRPYALAKIAGIEMCWSYNRQYGTQYLAAMPTNLYGPGDNYHPDNSHVIPALIRKFHEAKVANAPTVTVWGSGTPRREFMYSEDMADACVFVMNLPDEQYTRLLGSDESQIGKFEPPLINIGVGHDVTIKELAETVRQVVGFEGAIVFDASKPDGTPRKLMDVSRLTSADFSPVTTLEHGLTKRMRIFLGKLSFAALQRSSLRHGIASALDQVLLSVLNLVISFAFIRFASKEDYGVYLLLLTPLYLATGAQNALVSSPTTTVLPATDASRRSTVQNTAVSLQVAFALIAGSLCGIGLGVYQSVVAMKSPILLCIGFGLAASGICAREGSRTLFYSLNRAVDALRSDLTYALGLLIGVALLCQFQALSPQLVLLCTGIAALWPYLFKLSYLTRLHIDRQVTADFWACGRWALVGMLVTWLNLNAYPLIVGAKLDTHAVADINVARLFLMPVGLCITAWSNLHRPTISAWSATGHTQKIQLLTVQSVGVGLAMLGVYCGALILAYPALERLLGSTYQGLAPLVIAWSLYFAASMIRTMLMATLMTDAQGYRLLQKFSWVALAVSLNGFWWLSANGAVWVIGTLIAVELVQLILVGREVARHWALPQA